MAETSKQSPWRTPPQEEMGFLQHGEEEDQRRGSERKKTQRPDGSVLLDMERLSLLVDPSTNANTAPEAGTIANPRGPMLLQTNLSRKLSQRGERKAAADVENLLPTTTSAAGDGGGRGGAALSIATAAATGPLMAAASDKFIAVALPPAAALEATTATAATASPRQAAPCRRAHGRRAAASSPWLDPRRVLLFFATLSSMGTIILLYFTLSIGKMGDGDADAR